MFIWLQEQYITVLLFLLTVLLFNFVYTRVYIRFKMNKDWIGYFFKCTCYDVSISAELCSN